MKIFITTMVLTVSLNAFCQTPKFVKSYYVNKLDSLSYQLLYPQNYSSGNKFPLILFLHGAGQRGKDDNTVLKSVPTAFVDSLARINYPCFILVPQCPKKDVWVNFPSFPTSLATTDTPTTAARLTIGLVDQLLKGLPIDKQRVYITGFSMGGEGTFDFLSRRPSLFAGAIPICGVADTSKAKYLKDIPVWIFHGEEDQVTHVEYSRLIVASLKKAGGAPFYTEYKGAKHNCWAQAYSTPDLLSWLFSKSLKK